ncbi:DHH family phosphoesterase [Lachnoclostridium phytofermentans]|uniref:Phosphoesterase RecJ domain protein n=1 Tax=Lachnoclostridium phytofermentans (strain ATCC 700394 / DSM 18823 / ISDg) TaxID=357809 RepID=A9KNW2_LACP7|nr:bifunctional oligoribonuclease/PAP phosphatase NrnA [Lachnoclostridium phytofermentans]ABX43132.1 phosphoesterase RecJ domain protein [Lachnoclostridium phytofermentans ISDg]
MKRFEEDIRKANRIGITGHVRPDGDCTSSCLALYNYLQENYNADRTKTIDLHLEPIAEPFRFLTSSNCIQSDYKDEEPYDLFFALDCGSLDRLGAAQYYAMQAKKTVNIDHHISNTGFASVTLMVSDSSSTCEVLYDLFDVDKISKATAEALYLGIVHDTGVFKHSNTTEKTMAIAGKLITLGATPNKIIDETFYQKTFVQNQVLGRCLLESILLLDGKIIVSSISKRAQNFYNVVPSDLDGVIDQLRITKGVEVAIFLREDDVQEYKVSMRSNGIVDVSKIAVFFGGGGHILAAGCSMKGSLHDVINNLTIGIEHQLKNAEKC